MDFPEIQDRWYESALSMMAPLGRVFFAKSGTGGSHVMHKYVMKKPDGKGGWVYYYRKPDGTLYSAQDKPQREVTQWLATIRGALSRLRKQMGDNPTPEQKKREARLLKEQAHAMAHKKSGKTHAEDLPHDEDEEKQPKPPAPKPPEKPAESNGDVRPMRVGVSHPEGTPVEVVKRVDALSDVINKVLSRDIPDRWLDLFHKESMSAFKGISDLPLAQQKAFARAVGKLYTSLQTEMARGQKEEHGQAALGAAQAMAGKIYSETKRIIDAGQQEEEKRKKAEEKKPETDYRMQHRPPGRESGAALHDLTSNSVFPKDVYSTLRDYGSGDPKLDREAFDIIQKMKGKPDGTVTIYRAVPKGKENEPIRPGDWVAITHGYAKQHSLDLEGPGKDGTVIKMQVPASTIFTNGDSIQEWGYDPGTKSEKPTTSSKAPKSKAEEASEAATKREAEMLHNGDTSSGAYRKLAELHNAASSAWTEHARDVEGDAAKMAAYDKAREHAKIAEGHSRVADLHAEDEKKHGGKEKTGGTHSSDYKPSKKATPENLPPHAGSLFKEDGKWKVWAGAASPTDHHVREVIAHFGDFAVTKDANGYRNVTHIPTGLNAGESPGMGAKKATIDDLKAYARHLGSRASTDGWDPKTHFANGIHRGSDDPVQYPPGFNKKLNEAAAEYRGILLDREERRKGLDPKERAKRETEERAKDADNMSELAHMYDKADSHERAAIAHRRLSADTNRTKNQQREHAERAQKHELRAQQLRDEKRKDVSESAWQATNAAENKHTDPAMHRKAAEAHRHAAEHGRKDRRDDHLAHARTHEDRAMVLDERRKSGGKMAKSTFVIRRGEEPLQKAVATFAQLRASARKTKKKVIAAKCSKNGERSMSKAHDYDPMLRKHFRQEGTDELSKGLYKFGGYGAKDANLLPPEYLAAYLDAFIEEAYEHESRETEHTEGQTVVGMGTTLPMYFANLVFNELVSYMTGNKNLLAAAKKFKVDVQYVCDRITDMGLIQPQAEAAKDRGSFDSGYSDSDPIMGSPFAKSTSSLDAAFAAYESEQKGVSLFKSEQVFVSLDEGETLSDVFAKSQRARDSRIRSMYGSDGIEESEKDLFDI